MPKTRQQADDRPVYVIDRDTFFGAGYFGPNTCRLLVRALRAHAASEEEGPEATAALILLAELFASVWKPEAGHPDA